MPKRKRFFSVDPFPKSLTISLSLSWSYHVSSRSHWKKKTHLENSDIIKQGPRVRVCASLTQEVRVTSHLRSIHVLPVQQHHHVLLFNNIIINFTILSLISTSISKPTHSITLSSTHPINWHHHRLHCHHHHHHHNHRHNHHHRCHHQPCQPPD